VDPEDAGTGPGDGERVLEELPALLFIHLCIYFGEGVCLNSPELNARIYAILVYNGEMTLNGRV
jgi:hypothetical protein